MADMKNQHKANLHIFKLSYTKQVEELNEIIGSMSIAISHLGRHQASFDFKLIYLEQEKREHGSTLVGIINKCINFRAMYKEKYQALKTEKKKLSKKHNSLEQEFKVIKEKYGKIVLQMSPLYLKNLNKIVRQGSQTFEEYAKGVEIDKKEGKIEFNLIT